MGRRATKVPRVPVCTQPRDPPLTGYPQLPQPSISRPLQRSKDVQTHLLQLPLAGTLMNGERLHGLLCHMRSCKVTKAQTLSEVETAADTIQTVVLYLDGLHRTTSRLRGILRYPGNHRLSDKAGNIHTLPRHGERSPGSTVVPHPCILQTRGPCAHHIGPRL